MMRVPLHFFVVTGLLFAPACLFFDETIYCDTASDCPSGAFCDVELGVCKTGAGDGGPADDAGPGDDAGPRPDAGPDDAGPAPEDGGSPGPDGGPQGDSGPEDAGDVDSGPTAPSAPVVTITPDPPRTLDELRAVVVTESVATAGVTYTYAWHLGTTLQADLTSDSVPAARTAKGQSWRVVVTPTAGGVVGAAGEDTKTIANTPPSLTGVALYPMNPTRAETLRAVPIGFSDPDTSDQQIVEFRWYQMTTSGEAQLNPTTATIDGSQLFGFGDDTTIRVQAIPRDSPTAGSNGTPIETCPRPVVAGPVWRDHYPVRYWGDASLGTGYLRLDLAHDRLLFGLNHGTGTGGAFELSLESTPPRWSQVTVGLPDPFPFWASELWIPGRNTRLHYGGVVLDPALAVSSALWELDVRHGCEAWNTVTAQGTAPEGRMGTSAVYDPVAHRAVITLGATYDVDFIGSSETWALSLDEGTESWTLLAPAGTVPPLRGLGSASYDPVAHEMIIFGGLDVTQISTPAPFADVHALSLEENLEAWRTLTPTGTGPGPVVFAGVGVDPEEHQLIVIGGCAQQNNCASTYSGQAFALSLDVGSESWSALTINGETLLGPVLDMQWHPRRGTFLLFVSDVAGGVDGGNGGDFEIMELSPGATATEWTLATLWSSTDDVLASRSRHALIADGNQHDGLLAVLGGFENGYAPDESARADVWRFDVDTGRWATVTQGGAVPGPRHSFAWGAGSHDHDGGSAFTTPLTLFGGRCEVSAATFETCAGTYQMQIISGVVTWQQLSGSEPSARWGGAGFLARDGFGGRALRVLSGELEDGSLVVGGSTFVEAFTSPTFANGTWSPDPTSDVPSRRDAATAVSPGSLDLVYVYGGSDSTGAATDTLFVSSAIDDDTTAWEPLPPPLTGTWPSARAGATLTHVHKDVYLLIGGDPFSIGDEATLLLACDDAATPVLCEWHDLVPSAGPIPAYRANHAALYDPTRDRVWIVGGEGGSSVANRQTWSLGPMTPAAQGL